MTSSFHILPAIDLQGGRVVRLRQGDFDRTTAFSDDPAAIARAFVDAGAHWLHVVDLDGARDGVPAHVPAIQAIVALVGTRAAVEVAGGLRDEATVAAVLAAGAARAVIGTAALRDPDLAARLVERHGPDRVAVALDVRDGLAIGEGWRRGAPGVAAETALTTLADAGVTTFEATAIDRDGLLGGPDLDLLGRLVGLGRGGIIASGGITTLDDLRAVEALGCAGAIIGRALYEGRIRLEDLRSGDTP
ncbi:MAG: 1-(5-phosphoribosyl)-5-[(5-phosphoribosylamino)methylideneamino]imidazole-4-carboxamide isomerase [Candidatus Limnocylindrales bacterium]